MQISFIIDKYYSIRFPKLNFTNNEHFCVCEGGNVMDLRLQLATHYSSFIDKT